MDNFSTTTQIFRNAINISHATVPVYSNTFTEFHKKYTNFLKSLPIDVKNDVDLYARLLPIRYFIGRHKKYPLPFNYTESISDCEKYSNYMQNIEINEPDYFNELLELELAFKNITSKQENPLEDIFFNLLNDKEFDINGTIGILFPDTGFLEYFENYKRKIINNTETEIIFISKNDLTKNNLTFDNIIIFGEQRHYIKQGIHENIHSLANAENYYWIQYKTQYNPKQNDLDELTDSIYNITQNIYEIDKYKYLNTTDIDINTDILDNYDEDIPPDIEALIASKSLINYDNHDTQIEKQLSEQECILAIFDNDKRVFLANEERLYFFSYYDKKNNISEERKIKREFPINIQQGDYYCQFEKDQGNDFLSIYANRIMSENGYSPQLYRDSQVKWKNALISKAKEYTTIDSLVEELRKKGCTVANSSNLKYWIKPNTLYLKESINFRILLKFIGLEKESELIIKHMRFLNSQHIKAGGKIKNEIEKKINNTSIEELENKTEPSIYINDINLTINFRMVSSINTNIQMINSKQIGQIMERY